MLSNPTIPAIADALITYGDWFGTVTDVDSLNAALWDDFNDSDRTAYDIADYLWDDGGMFGVLDPMDICRYLNHIGMPNSDPDSMPC